MNLQNEAQQVAQAAAALRQRVISAIADLPDNPDINRLSRNCFAVSFSKLQSNWSPEFHDFEKQKELLIGLINGMDVLYLVSNLTRILRDERIVIGKARYTLHPKMIEAIREALCLGENSKSVRVKRTIVKPVGNAQPADPVAARMHLRLPESFGRRR